MLSDSGEVFLEHLLLSRYPSRTTLALSWYETKSIHPNVQNGSSAAPNLRPDLLGKHTQVEVGMVPGGIAQRVARLVLRAKNRFPHKSVNLFFTLVILKDKFTYLCGN